MNRQLCLAVAAALLCVTPCYGILIDSFQTPQSVSASGAQDLQVNQVSGPGILESYRDVAAFNFTQGASSVLVNSGVATFNVTNGSTSAFGFTWDGFQQGLPFSPSTFNHVVDLTDGGTKNALSFVVNSSDAPFQLQVSVFSSVADWIVIDIPSDITSPRVYTVPFQDFLTHNNSGNHINYELVTAVSLQANNVGPGGTLQLGTIETVFVPEPSSIALASLGMIAFLIVRRGR